MTELTEDRLREAVSARELWSQMLKAVQAALGWTDTQVNNLFAAAAAL